MRHSQNVLLELALGITNVCGQKEMQAPHVGHGWDPDSCKAFSLHGASPGNHPNIALNHTGRLQNTQWPKVDEETAL